MSIGLGIFLSAVLVIVVWQVDKRGAWRPAMRFSVWSLGVLVIIGSGVGGWIWWTDSGEARTHRARASAVRAGSFDEYWGIKLRMTQQQVLYLKGEPSERIPKTEDSFAQWVYSDDGDVHEYYVLFDDQNQVDVVGCYLRENTYSAADCESIAGVSIGTYEDRLIEILGTPTESSELDEKGNKSLTYGSDKQRVFFNLRKARVMFYGIDKGRRKRNA